MSLHITVLSIFSSSIFYIGQKNTMKVQTLTLSSVLMKIFQILHVIFQPKSQFFFQILHESSVSWKIFPLYFFRLNVIFFARKRPIKVHIFETFDCSDQNSPDSCHFWNNKLVFLQILNHSSVSWDISPLYILAEILHTFNEKSLSKYKFGEN